MTENVRADLTKRFMSHVKAAKAAGKEPLPFDNYKQEYAKHFKIEDIDGQINNATTGMDYAKTAGRNALDSVSFGFADDIAGYFDPEMGQDMRSALEASSAMDPKTALGGAVGGALLPIPGLAAAGLARGGGKLATSVLGRAAKHPLKLAAAGGATYEVGSMDPEERGANLETASAAGLGAAQGLAGGYAGQKIVQGLNKGGRILDKVTGRNVNKQQLTQEFDRVLDSAAPMDATAARNMYGRMGDAAGRGELTAPKLDAMGRPISQVAKRAYEPESRTAFRETTGMLEKHFRDNPGVMESVRNVNDIVQNFSRSIGRDKNSSRFGELITAKDVAMKELYRAVDAGGGDSQQLKAVRNMWSRMLKEEAVRDAVEQAIDKKTGKFSQAGFSTAMVQGAEKLKKIGASGKLHWTEAELADIRRLASRKGTGVLNRVMAKAVPGSLMGNILHGGVAVTAGPLAGITGAGASLVAKKAQEGATERMIDELIDNIWGRSRSVISRAMAPGLGVVGANDLTTNVPVGMLEEATRPPGPLELTITKGRVGGN